MRKKNATTLYEISIYSGSDYDKHRHRQDRPGAQGCRLYSPYAVAGYIPADPELIAAHLLELLAAGEAVPCKFGCLNATDFFVLRGSMLDPAFRCYNRAIIYGESV